MADKYRYKGKTQNIRAWAIEYNMPYHNLYYRVVVGGWTIRKALETPIKKRFDKKYKYKYKGKLKTLSEWAKEHKINYHVLYQRITRQKWSIKKAIETPLRKVPVLKYRGKKTTLMELSKEFDIPYGTLRMRINTYKWPLKKAVTQPVGRYAKRKKSKTKK